jgi:hypothetical protein
MWQADVVSDVYLGAQHDEDGEQREHLAWYVTLTNDRGDRYGSRRVFTTEMFPRDECEGRATAHMERVVDFLRRGHSPVDSDKWTRMDPVYGSEAYQRYGAADDLVAEYKNGDRETPY